MSTESAPLIPEKQKDHVNESVHRLGFRDGTLEYLELQGSPDNNPIVLIPGFTEGKVSLHGFATELCTQGDATVLLPDQYERRKKGLLIKEQAVHNQAKVLLAMIADRGLEHVPVDVVAHSFGSIIFDDMARQADELGWTCFEGELGSSVVFLAPAGTNPEETRHSLAKRFGGFVATESKTGWDKAALDAGPENVKKDPLKYVGEALAVSSREFVIDYGRLSKIGVRPHVVVYSNESVYPHELVGDTVGAALEAGHIETYSSPLDSRKGGVGLLGVLSMQQLIDDGMSKKQAKAAWQHSNAGAQHNRFMIIPEVDAATVLGVLRQSR